MKSIGYAVLGMVLGATPVRAQAADDPLAVLRASNDRIHRFAMDNGIVGVVKPDRSAPVAAIQLWFGTGSIHEDNFLGAGLSHYVEHMIFKGTPTRTPGDISRQIGSAGGRVNAYTSFDRTVFHVVLPSENWETGLDVLSDAVMNAAFPADEWESERQGIVQEMKMHRDDPRRELNRLLWSTAFRVHPYRHPVIGYEEVFLQTTRQDLLDFFRRHYTPDNMIFAVAGDVDPGEVERRAREAFAGFRRRARAPVIIPAEPPQLAPRFARQVGRYEVSRAAWGWPTVALHHPDAAGLDVLAVVVGGGQSSRLTLALRDRLQLVHSISAWSFTPGEPGLFGIHATFDPEKEAEVIEAVRAEMASWRDSPFTDAEIDRARRQVLVSTLSALATARGQVHSIASGEFYAGDPRFSEAYLAALDAVTPETLHRLVDRYLRDTSRTLVLLTPEGATAEAAQADAEPLLRAPVRVTLDNGAPLIVREDRRLPLAYVTVAFLGGVISETEGNQGVTQFMADLLTRGTAARSAQDIAERLESLGASLTPFAGMNSFGLQGMSLSGDLDELLEMAAHVLVESAFPDTEVERQRRRQLADLRSQRERPMSIADDLVREALYPEHPFRWTPLGAEATVARFSRDDLLAHLHRHLVAGNMALSVVGPVTPDEARARFNRHFAAIPRGDSSVALGAHTWPALPVTVRSREPREQTIYLMAFPGVDVRDGRGDALDLLQSALSGLSSNLGMEVREKRGLVYFVGAFQRAGLAPGRFVLYAGTSEEAVPEMQALMEAEIARLVNEGLTDEEIARAQAQLVGAFHASLQNSAALAQVNALNELYGRGYDYEFQREARLRALTREDVRRAAADILDLDRRVIAIVLPAEN